MGRTVIAVLLLMVAGLQTAEAQSIILTLKDNSKVKFDISELKEVSFEEADEAAYVDLGLPSRTLWATCNVGANSPEEYGYYFAWGETEPKSTYDWSTYVWCEGSNDTMTKYCTQSESGYNGFTDGLTELLPENDAATVNWGSDWCMPSLDQMKELFNSEYTTTEWTQVNGVDGHRITGKNGNSIFLPAAGFHDLDQFGLDGSYGYYWSRTLGPDGNCDAYSLYFNSRFPNWSFFKRSYGYSVRAVRR